MYYLPNIFNEMDLFQHLGDFVEKDGDKRKIQINEFLLHATSVVLSLSRINYLNDLCVKQFSAEKGNLNLDNISPVLFSSPQMVEMTTLMPACFSSLCVMQDKIFPMLDYILGLKNPPQSFHDICKKITAYKMRQEVIDLTIKYWNVIGKQTRDYRDVGQHFYNLVSHSYYQLSPTEKTTVLLPDNPSKKSYSEFTYLEEIDSRMFLINAFNKLHSYLEEVLTILGFGKKNLQFRFDMGSAPRVLQEGAKQTLVLALYDDQATQGIEIGHNKNRTIYVRGIGTWMNKKS